MCFLLEKGLVFFVLRKQEKKRKVDEKRIFQLKEFFCRKIKHYGEK